MQASVHPAQTSRPPLAAGIKLESALMILCVAVTAIVMLAHLATLTIYPRVFIDEAWLSNTSWTWLTTGVNFDSMNAGVLDQFGYEWARSYFVGELPYVAMFNVLGLGVFQARLVAWIFGCVLLFALVRVGQRIYSLKTGLLAALLLSLALPFLQATRFRQDIMLTAFIMIAFWLALVALQDNKWWAHFAAGLVLGISPDVHQTATLFMPALALLYVAYYGRSVLMRRGTWLAGIGGALGLLIFALVHILPNPEVYAKLMSFNVGSGAEAELPLTNPARIIASAIGELGRYGFRQNPVDLALIGLGALLLLWRRGRADGWVLVFSGAAFANFVLLSGNKTNLYAIHLYPFFMLIVAEFWLFVLRRAERVRLLRIGAAVLLVAYVGFSALRMAGLVSSARDYDYYAITDPMRAVIPQDALVMAMPMWWFGLSDYDFRSSLVLTYYQFFNDYDAGQALEVMQPDYIVMDEIQRLLLVEEGDDLGPGLNAYAVSRPAFMQVLDARGEMVLAFDNPYHGHFEIYALDWGARD